MEYFAVALFSIGVIGIPIAVLLYNDYGKSGGAAGDAPPVEIVFFAIRTSILTNRNKSTKRDVWISRRLFLLVLPSLV